MSRGGEWRVQGTAAGLLLLLLLAPLATAADSARFTTEGALRLPPDATVELSPQAVYVNGTSDVSEITLLAPRVVLDVAMHEAPQVGIADVSVAGTSKGGSRRYELHDVVLTLAAPGPGYVGIYPAAGARAGLVAEGGLTLIPQPALQVGGVVNQPDEAIAGQSGYGRTLAGPILDVRTHGLLTYEGPGVLKLNGPRVTIEALENTSTFDTGTLLRGEPPLRVINETWVVLTFDQGLVTLRHPRMQVAADEAGVAWTGTAFVDAMRGELQTSDGTYAAAGEGATLDGDFAGDVAAQRSPGGQAIASAQLEGALASTSLSPVSRTAAPAPARKALDLGVLVVASVVVGVSGALLYGRHRLRQAAPDLTVEQCRDLADAAMENLRFSDALEWLEKAQVLAPSSARLWMDKGYCHASLGDVPEALAAYARASALSTDGEADLLAAGLLLRAGEPDLDEAERHVERALERSPAMALEVHLDSVFDPLRDRPRFARTLRRALGERDN